MRKKKREDSRVCRVRDNEPIRKKKREDSRECRIRKEDSEGW